MLVESDVLTEKPVEPLTTSEKAAFIVQEEIRAELSTKPGLMTTAFNKQVCIDW